jgi:hypothetical protein
MSFPFRTHNIMILLAPLAPLATDVLAYHQGAIIASHAPQYPP